MQRVERKEILRAMVWIQGIGRWCGSRAFPIKQAVFANFTPDKSNTFLPSDSFPRPLPSCHGPFLCLQTVLPCQLSALALSGLELARPTLVSCVWESSALLPSDCVSRSPSFPALCGEKNGEEMNFKGKKPPFLFPNDYCEIWNSSQSLHNFFFDFPFHV